MPLVQATRNQAQRLRIAGETEAVDMDQPRLALDFHAFARHFVKRHAFDFDGGNHGRHLHLVALKGGGGLR